MRHTGTKDTMPYHQWKHAVIVDAHVSEADAHQFAGRERIKLWFEAGEPVWMAADALKTFVRNGKRDERAARDISPVHNMIKVRT